MFSSSGLRSLQLFSLLLPLLIPVIVSASDLTTASTSFNINDSYRSLHAKEASARKLQNGTSCQLCADGGNTSTTFNAAKPFPFPNQQDLLSPPFNDLPDKSCGSLNAVLSQPNIFQECPDPATTTTTVSFDMAAYCECSGTEIPNLCDGLCPPGSLVPIEYRDLVVTPDNAPQNYLTCGEISILVDYTQDEILCKAFKINFMLDCCLSQQDADAMNATLEPTITPTNVTTTPPTTSSPTTSSPTPAGPVVTGAPTMTLLTPTSAMPTAAVITPTTAMPTTLSPTSLSPTASQPTTAMPTASGPTTIAPTTLVPTAPPTEAPTSKAPTPAPTTQVPTKLPTLAPTTASPTPKPTTSRPTPQPGSPTATPTTARPTLPPTNFPTLQPTPNPTTAAPTTGAPSLVPSQQPTSQPTTSCPVCAGNIVASNTLPDGILCGDWLVTASRTDGESENCLLEQAAGIKYCGCSAPANAQPCNQCGGPTELPDARGLTCESLRGMINVDGFRTCNILTTKYSFLCGCNNAPAPVCNLCPNNGEFVGNKEFPTPVDVSRVLPQVFGDVTDLSCRGLESIYAVQTAETCSAIGPSLFGTSPFDLTAWCGCPGVPPPQVCGDLCVEGTYIPTDRESIVPDDELGLSCIEWNDRVKYLSDPRPCSSVQSVRTLCCTGTPAPTTQSPTLFPTTKPSLSPTTANPTVTTGNPSASPTSATPSRQPTPGPSESPSDTPTGGPTNNPTRVPTLIPTTDMPTTAMPTTSNPTVSPGNPTATPTTAQPTPSPTTQPPTEQPTTARPTTASPVSASPTPLRPTTVSPTTPSPTTPKPTTGPTIEMTTVEIKSAFLMYNTDGLTSVEAASQPGNVAVLNAAWSDFVDKVVAEVEGKRQQPRLLRFRRRLEVNLVDDSAKVYGVVDVDCPRNADPPVPNGANCQNVDGRYDLSLTNDEDPEAVEKEYTDATDKAIDDGQLQESLDATAPNSPFTVMGLASDEPKDDGKGKMPWWQILLIVLACVFGVGGMGCIAATFFMKPKEDMEKEEPMRIEQMGLISAGEQSEADAAIPSTVNVSVGPTEEEQDMNGDEQDEDDDDDDESEDYDDEDSPERQDSVSHEDSDPTVTVYAEQSYMGDVETEPLESDSEEEVLPPPPGPKSVGDDSADGFFNETGSQDSQSDDSSSSGSDEFDEGSDLVPKTVFSADSELPFTLPNNEGGEEASGHRGRDPSIRGINGDPPPMSAPWAVGDDPTAGPPRDDPSAAFAMHTGKDPSEGPRGDDPSAAPFSVIGSEDPSVEPWHDDDDLSSLAYSLRSSAKGSASGAAGSIL